MKVFPTPTFVRVLLDSALIGDNVSTRWQGSAEALPAATVTLLRDSEPLQPWTTATAQIDVWHESELAAGELAYAIAEHWRTRTSAVVNGVAVAGFWVEQMPRPFQDDTNTSRYLMELGLIISQETS